MTIPTRVVERYDDKVSKRILSETPTPPGGWVEFMKWLTKTLQYPAAAKENKLQGTVNITFIINADGTVDDVRIKSGKVPVLNDEVLRVLKTMGKWKPGIEKNKTMPFADRDSVCLPTCIRLFDPPKSLQRLF